MTPKELFNGNKTSFMATCRLAAMRGYISKGSIPGSRLERYGWGGVAGYLELPAPWEDLKAEVDRLGAGAIAREYHAWVSRYEAWRMAQPPEAATSSKEFAMQDKVPAFSE